MKMFNMSQFLEAQAFFTPTVDRRGSEQEFNEMPLTWKVVG
jgi:hypothetical protein